MIVGDIVLVAALATFLAAWWLHTWPARGTVLLLASGVALIAGIVGVIDDRWQAGVGIVAAAVFLLTAVLGRLRRRPLRGGGRAAAGVVLTLLGALGIVIIVMFPLSPLPPPSGPHAVGVRSFALADEARRGVLGVPADQPRRLLLRVWYPATPAPGASPRPYFNEAEARTTARGFGELIGFAPLLTHLKHVRTNAYEDAPLQAGSQALPTVFFSPGYIGYAQSNSTLMEELASHGYVVYAVQHTGDSSPAVLPDGEVLPMDPGLVEHMQYIFTHGLAEVMVRAYGSKDFDERLDAQLQITTALKPPADRGFMVSAPVWLADRLFVHDALQAGAAPANVAEIVAASNLARTGEAGISFGGSTSGAVCMVDPRCAAAVNLDGGDFHLTPFAADLPVPLLMFHADFAGFYRMLGVEPHAGMRSFNDFSYESFEKAGTRADVYRMMLKRSMHAGLTDNGLFMRRPLRDELFGSAPVDTLIGAQLDFVRAFFDKHLRGIDNDFPQAQYSAYEGWVTPYDNTPVRDWWLAKPEAERERLQRRIDDTKARLGLSDLKERP